MMDENFARLRAHRNNIYRYRRLLDTNLSELERSYIMKRLDEEQVAFQSLSHQTLPIVLPVERRAKHSGVTLRRGSQS
jgi:hypothetical protein